MGRYEDNLQILDLIKLYLQNNKEQRFTQALYNLGVVESLECGISYKDNYHVESSKTLEIVKERLATSYHQGNKSRDRKQNKFIRGVNGF